LTSGQIAGSSSYKSERVTHALILAAGGGKRLNDHCGGHHKCMLRMFDKPLVQYSLDNAVRARVSRTSSSIPGGSSMTTGNWATIVFRGRGG